MKGGKGMRNGEEERRRKETGCQQHFMGGTFAAISKLSIDAVSHGETD